MKVKNGLTKSLLFLKKNYAKNLSRSDDAKQRKEGDGLFTECRIVKVGTSNAMI